MDKSTLGRKITPKGREYCDKPGTACYYDKQDICVNCKRKKGWRKQRPVK